MNSAPPSCVHCGLPVPGGRRGGEGPFYCCFGCRIAREVALPAAAVGEDEAARPNTMLLRLGLGIFLALNIMVASWVPYSRDLFGGGVAGSEAETALYGLASHLALLLCTIVVALLGLPLLRDSVTALVAPAGGSVGGRVNAQLLIVIGVFSAFFLSVLHTVRGEGSLYFDTAATVLVVVTLGSYLEAGARRRATESAHRLLAALPARVAVAPRGASGPPREVAVEEVEVGDRVSVLPGEVVPVDGRVTEGVSRVDESSLTGEPWPRAVEEGDWVLAGSHNHEGRLWIEAERVARDTVLALMERALADARNHRPPIQRLADRVAAVFVPGVVVLAVALFAFFLVRGEPDRGLLRSLSVLLISCPCALGLAAPLATWHGLRRAAERGILVESPATLERAAAVDRVFFDKTGTLTSPEPALDRLETEGGVDRDWALAAAAALESASSHPIARALVAEARHRGVRFPPVDEARTVPGRGVEGRVEGRRLKLGSRRWAAEQGLLDRRIEAGDGDGGRNRAEIVLFDDAEVLARFAIEEAARPGLAAALAALDRLGLETAVLSGDAAGPARAFAASFGLTAEGGLLPEEKAERLRQARRRGGAVAMVGDGLNDAPVLAAADVGIAMGSGSDLAKRSGNVRLVTDRLARIPELLTLARDVRRRIRLNLAFAFGFNTVGIALAAGGLLRPFFAAVAMVLSSLAVVKISSGAGQAPTATDRAATGPSAPDRVMVGGRG